MKTSPKTNTLALAIWFLVASAGGCAKDADDSGSRMVLALGLAALAGRADIYPELGFPGTHNEVTGSFEGSISRYSVTVGGVAAVPISLPKAGTLQFTMPLVGGITENMNLPLIITRDGNEVFNKTIRYRPAPSIALNQPNGFVRGLGGVDQSSFFTLTVASAGPHLFNTFGYSGANVDLYYFSSPTGTPNLIANSGMHDAEFERINLTAGTYTVQVKWISGFDVGYRINIANGQVAPASTSNEAGSYARCYDFQGSGPIANLAAGCAALNATGYTLTGRCTFPSASGITTRHYYVPDGGGPGFDPFYAETTCTQAGFGSSNEDKAIFQF